MGSWVEEFRDPGNRSACLNGLATIMEEQRGEQRAETRPLGPEGAERGGQSLHLQAAFLSKPHTTSRHFRSSPGTLPTMA